MHIHKCWTTEPARKKDIKEAGKICKYYECVKKN